MRYHAAAATTLVLAFLRCGASWTWAAFVGFMLLFPLL